MATKIGPRWVKYTVTPHRCGRVVANEDALQHVSGDGADADELRLGIGGLGRDPLHSSTAEPAELVVLRVGEVEADARRVVGARVETHRHMAVVGRNGWKDL